MSDRIIVFTGAFGVLGQAMAMEAAARGAAVILFLASDQATAVTGALIPVTGGV